MGDIHDIPFGGYSTPIPFSVTFAPDVGFEVKLSFQDNYSGIDLSTSKVVFSSGTNINYFYIYYSNSESADEEGLSVGYVDVALSGENKGVYSLSISSFSFNLIPEDNTAPKILQLALTSTTQTTVRFYLSVSEICVAYYMVALAGTAEPDFEEVKNQGPAPYQTTESNYGSLYIGKEERISFPIEDLEAETSYVLYVYLEDRGYNVVEQPASVTFTTEDRYKAAIVTMKFNQANMSSAEIELSLSYVAFILALPTSKVVEDQYSSRRMLADDESTFVKFHVLPCPDSEVYPSPLKLASELYERDTKSYLTKKLSTFDSSYSIQISEYARYVPSFSGDVEFVENTETSATFKARLDNYGWVYAVAIKSSEASDVPSPTQIKSGFNSVNVEVFSCSVEITGKQEYFYFSFSSLDSETEYTAYIVGASANPGYPDVMSSSDIQVEEFSTEVETIRNYSKSGKANQIASRVLGAVIGCLLIGLWI